jgi:hypothetical protein
MSLIGIAFFALLAGQIALRLLRPEPTPDWYRILIIVTAVGMIACLIGPPVAARIRRPKPPVPADDSPPVP